MFTRISTRTIIQSSSTPLLTTPITSTSTSISSSSCTCTRSISTYIPDVRAAMLNPKPSTPIPAPGEPILSPSGHALSRKAAYKAAARRATSFYMDSVELARTRFPWMVTGVRQARPKIPIELRKPGPEYLMKQLRAEETTRVVKSYPRSIEKFRAGDKIAVVKKISLHAPKYDIITGTVIARWGGAGLSASFTVRNYHEGHGYELSYPLHSPFIQRIVVLEKGDERRKKIYEIRDAPRESIAVKPVTLEYLDNIHDLRREIAEKKAVHKAFDISYQQQQNAAELQRLTTELKEKLKPWATSQNLSDIPIAPAPIKHKTAEQEQLEKTMAETVSRIKKASKKGAATTTSTHGKDKSK